MLRLARSWNAESRLRAVASWIQDLSPDASVVVVADTRESADSFVREHAASAPATFNRRRTSLAQFALHLATTELARSALAPASELAQGAVTSQAVHELLPSGRLPALASIAGYPGFSRALGVTLREVRLNLAAGAVWPANDAMGEDVRALDSSFAHALADHELADRAAVFEGAVRAIAEGAHPWLATTILVLLDLALSNEAERRLVEALARVCRTVLATAPARDPTSGFLEVLGFEAEDLQDVPNAGAGVARLGRWLFDTGEPPLAPSDPSVRLFSAPGEGRECVEIVRFLLAEARAGVRFDEMAVLLRTPRVYAAHLDTALRRAGIPSYVARGVARPDPAGRAFVALLCTAEDGVSARRFGEYLSLGQVPPERRESSPAATWLPPDEEDVALEKADTNSPTAPGDDTPVARREPWRWEALLVEAAVIGGIDRWERRLGGLAEEVARARAATAKDDPDAPMLASLDRRLASLEGLRQFALPLLRELDRLRGVQQAWGSWLSELRALAVRGLHWPNRVLAVLTELEPMAEVGPIDITGVRSALEARMTSLEERPQDRRYGRVFIGSIDQARGRSFRVVFVPGFVEGQFPRRAREDPLLPDRTRRLVSPTLRTRDDRLEVERTLLRVAVGAASERLYLSYPRVDVLQARARVPSLYALEVIRAVRGRVPPVEELERDADVLTRARLAWPSPLTAAEAVDPLEYDLALLRGLLRHPNPASVKGRGRYLLEVNPWLAGSLRARHARWSRRWTPEDGFLPPTSGENPVADLLPSIRLSGRPYSVSALQKFAVCPYRFFLSAIQRLAPREDAVRIERLDPLTRGRILHRLYAATLRALMARGWVPLTAALVSAACDEAARVMAAIIAEEEDALAPAIRRVWRDEVEALRQDIHGWLRDLAARRDGWRPIHTELGFGIAANTEVDPSSRADPVVVGAERWLLRGAIDLVEEQAPTGPLRVTDYKTGATIANLGFRVGGGETLQPVVYGLVAEVVFGGREVREGRLFYASERGGYQERVVRLDARARDDARTVLTLVDRAIAEGCLPALPKAGACAWCDFRIVCGPYEESRVKPKDGSRKQDVEQLRRMT